MLVSVKKHVSDFNTSYHLAEWFYVGSRGVNDPIVKQTIDHAVIEYDMPYINTFKQWIKDYPHNSIVGIDNFEAVFSNGTTQAFDSFYMANHTRRFRFFPEEYPYHYVQVKTSMNYDFMCQDKLDLQPGDAVILSLPYANTGTAHPLTTQILQECNQKSIPVLLDLCYYFIAADQHIDLTYECIDTVSFSLSKLFPVGHSRIGLRLSNHKDGQNIYHNHRYINQLSEYIGYKLMKEFNPEYIYNKYKIKQLEICKYLEIEPSDSILFGLTTNPEFIQYSRDVMGKQHGVTVNDSNIYRAGIVNLLEEWEWIKHAVRI